MREIARDVLNELLKSEKGKKIILGTGYLSLEITKEQFQKLSESKEKRKIVFIDGGNQEIVGGANFSLSLIRIYYCIYKDNKRVKKKTKEFFVLIRSEVIDGKLKYTSKCYDTSENFGNFDLYENEHKIKAEKIVEKIRKLSEIRIIKELIKELESGDVVIRDGDLEAEDDREWLSYEEAYSKAKQKNVIICGLSKTNNIITNTGGSAVALLSEKMPAGKWMYYPCVKSLVDTHKAEICFAKLHPLSNHIFRFDIYKEQKEELKKVLESLGANSIDPSFIGYPYGLIDADRFGRVSNSEIEYYKLQIFTKGEKELRPYLSGNNAHSILDTIS